MGGGKLTPEQKQKQAIENKEILNRLYEQIMSNPLYNESIFEEYSGKYASPKTVMEKVEKGTMDLSTGIHNLKQWIKVLVIIADNSYKQRLHDILERNRDIIEKDTKQLDTELENRGLVLKF